MYYQDEPIDNNACLNFIDMLINDLHEFIDRKTSFIKTSFLIKIIIINLIFSIITLTLPCIIILFSEHTNEANSDIIFSWIHIGFNLFTIIMYDISKLTKKYCTHQYNIKFINNLFGYNLLFLFLLRFLTSILLMAHVLLLNSPLTIIFFIYTSIEIILTILWLIYQIYQCIYNYFFLGVCCNYVDEVTYV